MKLARIVHERCQEWSGYLHVIIPDDWDHDKLYKVVDKCVNEHIAAAKLYKANQEPINGYRPYSSGPNYKEYDPSKTIAEVNLEWASMKEEYETWQKTIEPAKLSFSKRLSENGIRMIWDLQGGYMDDPEDEDEILETTASWGHNHGLNFSYEEDKFQDMLPPGKSRDDYHGL